MPARRKGGYVYIITNRPKGTLYIGVTGDLVRRMDEHRRGAGARFASKYRLRRLVYFEHCLDVRSAIEREKQLKRWRREKKVGLIERENPEWRDLCEEWFDAG
jgi:putative endonuclease